jgi:AcrR family transcriptional regulator
VTPAGAAPAPRRPRAARGEGELLREHLLDAASALVHEQGNAASLSIRQITKAAGVSPMAFYLHFESLQELVGALIDHGFSRFRTALHAAVAEVPGDDARGRMRALGLAYLRFAREEPALYAVIFGDEHERQAETGEHEHGGVGMAAFEDLVEAIVACQQAGQARDGDARALAIGVWSTMHGFATLCAVHDEPKMPWPDDEAFVDMLFEAWLREERPVS